MQDVALLAPHADERARLTAARVHTRCCRGRWLLGRSIAYQLYADHQALPPYVTDQGAALLQIL